MENERAAHYDRVMLEAIADSELNLDDRVQMALDLSEQTREPIKVLVNETFELGGVRHSCLEINQLLQISEKFGFELTAHDLQFRRMHIASTTRPELVFLREASKSWVWGPSKLNDYIFVNPDLDRSPAF